MNVIIGVRMGGPGGGMCLPKNYIILCSTILLPAMYGSRCICITVMTHVPPLSFNPTECDEAVVTIVKTLKETLNVTVTIAIT